MTYLLGRSVYVDRLVVIGTEPTYFFSSLCRWWHHSRGTIVNQKRAGKWHNFLRNIFFFVPHDPQELSPIKLARMIRYIAVPFHFCSSWRSMPQKLRPRLCYCFFFFLSRAGEHTQPCSIGCGEPYHDKWIKVDFYMVFFQVFYAYAPRPSTSTTALSDLLNEQTGGVSIVFHVSVHCEPSREFLFISSRMLLPSIRVKRM